MNAKMSQLKACFEAAGFAHVKTVLSSGNVVFDAPAAQAAKLECTIEAAMQEQLDHSYVPSPRGPAFMQLLEKTFGKEITTRTWETLEKVARA